MYQCRAPQTLDVPSFSAATHRARQIGWDIRAEVNSGCRYRWCGWRVRNSPSSARAHRHRNPISPRVAFSSLGLCRTHSRGVRIARNCFRDARKRSEGSQAATISIRHHNAGRFRSAHRQRSRTLLLLYRYCRHRAGSQIQLSMIEHGRASASQ